MCMSSHATSFSQRCNNRLSSLTYGTISRTSSYADDVLLIVPSVSELHRLLHRCENELKWLNMRINEKILLYAYWLQI